MIDIILATHGRVGQEMLKVLEQIMGPQEAIQAISLETEMETSAFYQEMTDAIDQISYENSILILTDIFGSTPTNIALSFLGKERVEIISGVSLPLLMRIIHLRKQAISLKELSLKIEETGRQLIHSASKILSIPQSCTA